MNAARRELDALLLAVQFLTRWPVRVSGVFSEEGLSAMVRYYPLVGALIGAFAGGVFWLAHLVFPMSLAVVLSTAASLIATGALHEDGFADVCDGLGGTDREKTLAIMRDSRLGTYGAAGLGLMLATKILALVALPSHIVPWLLVAGARRQPVVLRACDRDESLRTSRRCGHTGRRDATSRWPPIRPGNWYGRGVWIGGWRMRRPLFPSV